MNIAEYLDGFELKEKRRVINNIEYSYVDARYLYNNNQFVRYFIIDVIAQNEFENVFDNWLDFSKFIQFERDLLEDEFFHCTGDERFNLYLVFIVKKDSKIYNTTEITKDFRYARKLIFNEEEAISFFHDIVSLKRENNDTLISDVSDRKKLVKELSESAKYADIYLKQELITLFNTNNTKKIVQKYEFINELMEINRLINKIFNIGDERNALRVKNYKNHEIYQIKDIESVVINNYRCYEKNKRIPFTRVNLIYGENGVGKTSILEAIELGITGMNRNDEKTEIKDSLIEVVCHNKLNSKVSLYSDKNNSELSLGWYGIEVNTNKEFNELFRKWNYFD